jgi:hypothetical protein
MSTYRAMICRSSTGHNRVKRSLRSPPPTCETMRGEHVAARAGGGPASLTLKLVAIITAS